MKESPGMIQDGYAAIGDLRPLLRWNEAVTLAREGSRTGLATVRFRHLPDGALTGIEFCLRS